MYSCSCIGLRGVCSILEVINEMFSLNQTCLPSYTSIRNWILKAGLSLYEEDPVYEGDYMEIIDESMMVGGEKLLLTLTADAQKRTNGSLVKSNMRATGIAISQSWNATSIQKELTKIENKADKAPLYAVSDNAGTLALAIKGKEYTHILDLSHTTGMLLERIYKNDPDYTTFSKDVSDVRFRDIMKKDTAYLLPPKQRSIARFMNVSHTIRWADQLLSAFERLTEKEKATFAFLKKHASFIEEFKEVTECINSVSKILKNKGLSYNSVSESIALIRKRYISANERMRLFNDEFISYLKRERMKLEDENSCWHISSDIIESVFGDYKYRKASNRLYGVTSFVLFLPVLMKFKEAETGQNQIIKKALADRKMKDITKWTEQNITQNMVVRRRKVLRFAESGKERD